MKVLVLGDCASAGTNNLTGEILGTEDISIQKSLQWNGQFLEQICAWYLAKTKGDRKPFKNRSELAHDAVNYLTQQEMKESYWQFVDFADSNVSLTNVSKTGATAGGYYKRLLKYEKIHGRPDIIYVTDHTKDHSHQVVNYLGKQYFYEQMYNEGQEYFQINHNWKSPVTAQRLAHSKRLAYFHNYAVEKRNKRIMTWFINYLDKNNYTYKKIKFCQDFFPEFDDSSTIDCSDLGAQYITANGDDVKAKIAVARDIAKRISTAYRVDKQNK